MRHGVSSPRALAIKTYGAINTWRHARGKAAKVIPGPGLAG
jgi:hypothetical protein